MGRHNIREAVTPKSNGASEPFYHKFDLNVDLKNADMVSEKGALDLVMISSSAG